MAQAIQCQILRSTLDISKILEEENDTDEDSDHSNYGDVGFVLPDFETEDEVSDAEIADAVEAIKENKEEVKDDEDTATLKRKRSGPGRPRKTMRSRSTEPVNWSDTAPDARGRRSYSCGAYTAGPKGRAREITTPLEAFQLLFNDKIMDMIVQHTNEHIEQELKLKTPNRGTSIYQKSTDKVEINAMLGLLFFSAIFKQNQMNTATMWSEEFGTPVYRSALSEHRFKFLLRMMRFDDKSTRPQRMKENLLAPINEIWELFLHNCSLYYEPSTNCTVHEQLVNFKGECPFKICIQSKPHKFGMKIIMMNDSVTSYMISAIPYIRKAEPSEEDSVPTYFVRRLIDMSSIAGTKRKLTMDSWCTSIPLFHILKDEYHLFAVGMIRRNKKGVPPSMKTPGALGSSRFLFTPDLTLVAYTHKKNQVDILLSSFHHNNALDGLTNKPQVLVDYNTYKAGTDTFDQMVRTYSTVRRTHRWPLNFFFNMLNQASVNACILYNFSADNVKLTRMKFLKSLALALVEPHLRRRLQLVTLKPGIKRSIAKILKIELHLDHTLSVIRDDVKAKCNFCDDEPEITDMQCPSCLNRMCDFHRSPLCVDCAKDMTE